MRDPEFELMDKWIQEREKEMDELEAMDHGAFGDLMERIAVSARAEGEGLPGRQVAEAAVFAGFHLLQAEIGATRAAGFIRALADGVGIALEGQKSGGIQ